MSLTRQLSDSTFKWTDAQGDKGHVEHVDELSMYGHAVAALLVTAKSGESAAVWLTRGEAERLRDWLSDRLSRDEAPGARAVPLDAVVKFLADDGKRTAAAKVWAEFGHARKAGT